MLLTPLGVGHLLILQGPCQGFVKELLGLYVHLRLPPLVQGQGNGVITIMDGGHCLLQVQVAKTEVSGAV